MKTLIAILIALSIATFAVAKDSTITACTQDHKKVELIASFSDGAPDQAVKDVHDAFVKVAKDLPYEVLADADGYHAFMASIPPDDFEYLTGFGGVPKIVGDCK